MTSPKYNVVFACDNNYAMPFAVVLESMLASKAVDTFYDVHCLVPGAFSKENVERIGQLAGKYEGFSLQYHDLADRFQDKEMTIKRISYVTYFRLLLPELLPDAKVCLYLDVDMIVCGDLRPLFSEDIKDCYLGAVRHPSKAYRKRNKIKSYDVPGEGYFNAGMLLMNLELMRRDNKQEEFLRLMDENFVLQDQDVMNVACTSRTKYLGLKYNAMTKLFKLGYGKQAKALYGEELVEAKTNPVIIHYADPEKPWQFTNLPFGQLWDDVFLKSVYQDQSLERQYFSPYLEYVQRLWFKVVRKVTKSFGKH